jgi:arylsulfatase A-like enzyme
MWIALFLPKVSNLSAADPVADRPNIVIVFADDLGYGDLGCYGAKGYSTPHLDRMAREGVRFTDFYVPQAVCSASRAALMTGCYPNRIGILGALNAFSRFGINEHETTIAEVLKSRGYATAIFGKWHLGFQQRFLPPRHGFDEYFGLPYSNDMQPNPKYPGGHPNLPLLDGLHTVESNPDQSNLTTWYTEHAVSFIERHRARPFFLYLPQSMPHVPLYVSEKFRGKTQRGTYGDVIEEIDWSVGQILATLERLKLDRRTLVIFTSDNGPWLPYGNHGGQSGPFREGKGTSFEGGVRTPCVMRWPGMIPAGHVCREPVMTIDLLPTFARLAGASVPTDRIIDGRDIFSLIRGDAGAKSPHESLYFYWGRELQAVRSGRWKLHLPHDFRSMNGITPGQDGRGSNYAKGKIGQVLYDLEADLGETRDVSDEHDDVVARLLQHAEAARQDLGDSATKRVGKNVRPPGAVPEKKLQIAE